jgi:CRP-like cAMP-binding protein
MAALEAVRVSDDEALQGVIPLLGDHEEEVQEAALERLRNAEHQNPELLIEALGLPDRRLRENVYELLETLEIRDVEILRFARGQLKRAYRNMSEAGALTELEKSPQRDLLMDHLLQKKRERVDTVLRVLSSQDRSGQMRMIWRGVFSADARQRSNAVEALDDLLGHALSKIIVPLLEESAESEMTAVARREFKLEGFRGDPAALCRHLLEKRDWVTVTLTLTLVEAGGCDGLGKVEACEPFLESENPHVRHVARRITQGEPSSKETDMETSISIPDKILHLKGIQIFEGLSVGEMAAIASVTEETAYPAGEIVIREGEAGETMYMIVSGQVSVHKKKEKEEEIELDRINPGDYFGEMALFEDEVRSATIRTVEASRLLVLHKREFEEIVREYPQIALHICKVLSHRLRKLHGRLEAGKAAETGARG